jgi:hypothetical protein
MDNVLIVVQPLDALQDIIVKMDNVFQINNQFVMLKEFHAHIQDLIKFHAQLNIILSLQHQIIVVLLLLEIKLGSLKNVMLAKINLFNIIGLKDVKTLLHVFINQNAHAMIIANLVFHVKLKVV